jgi:DUF4097 and DUF4098 domain-containing protein YvlB
MKRLVSLLVGAIVAVAAPALAQRKVDEVRPLNPDGIVRIDNLAGSVQVVGWGDPRVEITGVLGKNVRDLEISGDEQEIDISVDVPEHADDLESELTIRVPANAAVEVETVSATVQVEGVTGPVDVESVSGWVKVADRPSELSVETVSGEISAAFASSSTDLESVSGSIVVEDASGELDAQTVSGDIEVRSGLLGSASFETVSGNITFAADIGGRGALDFETMSGTVALAVSPGIAAEFDISTFSGEISNAIGPEARRTNQYTPEKELSFTTAGGGARVSIETFSGTVKITTQ